MEPENSPPWKKEIPNSKKEIPNLGGFFGDEILAKLYGDFVIRPYFWYPYFSQSSYFMENFGVFFCVAQLVCPAFLNRGLLRNQKKSLQGGGHHAEDQC